MSKLPTNPLVQQVLDETQFERGLIADASRANAKLAEVHELLSSIEALLNCCIAQAVGADIKLNRSRAIELHRALVIAKKATETNTL